MDAAVVPRVARCRDWVLAQQQRGELTLTQAVDAVEAQVGRVDATGSKERLRPLMLCKGPTVY